MKYLNVGSLSLLGPLLLYTSLIALYTEESFFAVAFLTSESNIKSTLRNVVTLRASPEEESEPICNDGGDSSSKMRRNMMLGVPPLLSILPTSETSSHQTNTAFAADVATTMSSTQMPLADLPMIRLRLPKGGAGRENIVIQLKINGKGPYDFMVDTGLTTEMITPHLRQELDIGRQSSTTVKGLAAGGDSAGGALVQLTGASLCCGKFSDPNVKEMQLPPLYAIVQDFPQEHMDPSHDPVEGMIGMEAIDMFDTDFDFPSGRIRFFAPGTGAAAATKAGMVEIPSVVINESGLLGIRVTSPSLPTGMAQPIIGIIDCGATFSAVNWAGAKLLGLPPKGDKSYDTNPVIMGIGVDGRPLQLATAKLGLTYAGNPQQGERGQMKFDEPPKNWKPWSPATIAVGDLPVFSQLLGDGRTPYNGPAFLLGLDYLSQRRIILETGRSRKRRMFVTPF